MSSVPPPFLPPLTFIMSDHATRPLAIELAAGISLIAPTTYVDDFLTPVYDGFTAMFNADWKRDMADPREAAMLPVPSVARGQETNSEQDVLNSLASWFENEFGPLSLSTLALRRYTENDDTFGGSYLFRDATPQYVRTFFPVVPSRDMLFIWLTPVCDLQTANAKHLMWGQTPSVVDILNQLTETFK
jgi:hypothetical protein